ncbi:phage tail protein [Rhodopila sp.]|uniref:phage tail protein n=1 Tax=Rhodopila sp. TaxID=2480087 RepID=UPI003D0C0E61
MTVHHPDVALNYRGLAYAGTAGYELPNGSPSMPSHNFEVLGFYSDTINGYDADASQVVTHFLSDPHCGCGFPAAMVGDLTTYQNYVISTGLFVSFMLDQQQAANSTLADLMTATNSEFVWSQMQLTVVPYGDETVTGNGKTYTPPSEPLFDLDDDDFLPKDAGPVQLKRTRPSDAYNSVQVEYLDRTNDYNTQIAQADDQASIDANGLRQITASASHIFCNATAANLSARLQLQRNLVRNQYTFSTDERYIALDPMDIISITDAKLGLNKQWVRILEMDINGDGTIDFTVEQYLAGTGHAPAYSFQTSSGYSQNYNADPGDCNVPVIFEPPVQLGTTSGLEAWMAISGGDLWGGAEVHISSDDENYKLAGRVLDKARQGALTATLPSSPDPDTMHTLSVDLSESDGQLLSGTQDDADQGHTLCYVGGELAAYQTATLTGANTYDLTYLRRGMYGTTASSHASGSQFARLDDAIFVYGYDKSQIGQTIYVKLLSFNLFQAGEQSLADVEPYSYTIQGPPHPDDVANFVVQQNGNTVNFTWSQVADYALKGYDIGYAAMGETDWHEFTLLTEASRGTEMTNAAVPPGTWTFGIKARDIADQVSAHIATFDLVVVNNNDTTTVQVQEADWAGTMVGFVRHWTGVLVPDSTTLANSTSDFTIFNNFVTDPVSTAYYITPSFDIGYINSLRIHSAYQITAGPGQSGGATASTQLDAWTTGSDPGTYVDWTVGEVPVRYLNMKIIYNPSAGAVGYLNDFTYTVDRSPLIEQVQNATIAAGGTTVTFPQPFHDVPYVVPTAISSTALFAAASMITTTDCVIHVWNASGTDVGGTVTIQAKGI